MFIRVKRVRNNKGGLREYLLLVESKRIKGRVKQITAANLGRLELFKNTQASDVLIDKLKDYAKLSRLMDMSSASCGWSKEYGLILILRRLWEALGLDNLFRRYLKQYKHRADLSECILSMVISRLINPLSEHSTAEWINTAYEPKWDKLKLQHFYRSLDFLYQHKSDLEKDLFLKAAGLFNQQLGLIMFDTTSIKYWGEGEYAQVLQRGYSKEKRGDLKQLIAGILMTKEGLPVGCGVFPGNTSDLKSFIQVVERIKNKYSLGRLIWVADRGMVSENNITKLNELNQEYILGVRMRQFNQEKKKELLSINKMIPVRDDLYVKEVKIEGQGRYIICFNPEEAEREFNNRQFFKQHLRKKLNTSTTKEWIIKNGYKKYVDFEGEVTLNEKKLLEESQYDGKWVLLTNTTLTAKEAALYYKGLWQIEASFKDLKQDLEASPIYHYKERRIIAHIFVSFLSLLLKITLKKKIKQIDDQASFKEVFEAVRQIKAVKLTEGRQEIIFRTELPPKAHIAFKALGVAPPARILSYKQRESVVSRLT